MSEQPVEPPPAAVESEEPAPEKRHKSKKHRSTGESGAEPVAPPSDDEKPHRRHKHERSGEDGEPEHKKSKRHHKKHEDEDSSSTSSKSSSDEKSKEEPSNPPPQTPKAYPARSPRHRQQRSQPPPTDSDDVSALSQQFLAGKPVNCDDPLLLAATVRDLENHRDNLMLEGSFNESLRAQKAVDTARAQQLDSCKKKNQSEVQEELNAKKDSAQQDYDQFRREMKEKEADLEQKLQDQIQATKARQQQELEDHDQQWQSEVKQRQFNRSSQKLRVLRTQQVLLMNAKRFDEAAQVCKIADNVVQRETQANHQQMMSEWLKSRALLQQRHEEEMDTLMKACETRRGEFRHWVDVSEKRHINRRNALQIEEQAAKDPERLWILRHRNDGDQIVNVMGATRSVKLNRTANVNDFNTLPLPPLPIHGSARRTKPQTAKMEHTA